MFYIWASVFVSGAVFFVILGEGETQEWALDEIEDREDFNNSDPVVEEKF